MPMSKKHYEAIAREFIYVRPAGGDELVKLHVNNALDVLAVNLAHEFAKDNANFMRGRFLDACGCGS